MTYLNYNTSPNSGRKQDLKNTFGTNLKLLSNSKSLSMMKNSPTSRTMRKSAVFTFALLFLVLLTSTSQAQNHKLTLGGGGGLSIPGDKEIFFNEGTGYNAYGFLLYNITPNISAGAGGSWIFGDKVFGDENKGNMAFYHAKGRYYLGDKKGRLYGGVNVGLGTFSVSTDDGTITHSGFAFGPEIGFALLWGNVGASYDFFLFNKKENEFPQKDIQTSVFNIHLGFNLDFIARE